MKKLILCLVLTLSAAAQEVVHFTKAPAVNVRELAAAPVPERTPRKRQHQDEKTPRPPAVSAIPQPRVRPTTTPTIPAPSMAAGFTSSASKIVDPADSSGAVGPNHIVSLTNEGLVVHNRAGAKLYEVLLQQFWAVEHRLDAYDPRLAYDARNDRWVMMSVIDEREVAIAVSVTGDPAGEWHRWYLPRSGADFSRLALTRDTVVFGTHYGDGHDAVFFSVAKNDLYALPASLPVKQYPAIIGFAPVSAPDDPVEYILWGDNGSVGVVQLEDIWKTPFMQVDGTFDWFGTEWFAPQKGGRDLDTGFGWIESATYREGFIHYVQTAFIDFSGSNLHAGIVWMKFNAANGSGVQNGYIGDPAGPYDRAFPSVAVNKDGAMLIGYSRFHEDEYASAAVTYIDPSGRMSHERVIKAGDSVGGGISGRWGDYTTTVTDPTGTEFWTAQIYATNNSWATWWAKVKPGKGKGKTRAIRH